MTHAGRRRALIALVLAPGLLRAQSAAAEVENLPPLGDLRVLADSIARHKAPLLVLFSTPGCPFCLEVRRNYLGPRVTEQAGKATPICCCAKRISLQNGPLSIYREYT